MADLDFSTATESRVSVNVTGWEADTKTALGAEMRKLAGVNEVQSTGGATGFFVYYDPAQTSEAELEASITEVAQRVRGFEPPSFKSSQDITEAIPPNVLRMDGDPITVDGEYVTFGEAPPTPPMVADPTTWTGSRLVNVDGEVIAKVRITAKRLQMAVHQANFRSDEDKRDLTGLADALVALCEMAEPELSIIDRITNHPKFKGYAALLVFVATIRGALGI